MNNGGSTKKIRFLLFGGMKGKALDKRKKKELGENYTSNMIDRKTNLLIAFHFLVSCEL